MQAIQPHSSIPLAGAVIHDGLVYVSGQVGFLPGTMQLAGATLEEQARQTMANVEALLNAAGSDRNQIIKCNVYLKHVERDFAPMNRIYSEWLGHHRPARTTVGAAMAIPEILIEIDCIAVAPAGR